MTYINRFDTSGKSITNKIYKGVENGTIRILATEVSSNARLDQLAFKYYGEGMNSWIIAAASGIRWQLGIGNGKNGTNSSSNEPVILFVPALEDVIKLKNNS
jgi:hypothetical protein